MRAASTLVGATLLIGAALLSSDSQAGATVDLLFVAKNGSAIAATDTVTAAPGDTLEMAVRFTNDVALVGYALSLNYDLDAKNELDVVRATQWVGVALNNSNSAGVRPIAPLGATTSTFVGSFNSGLTNPGSTLRLPPGSSYQIGTVVWTVNTGVNDDGADILSGFFNVGVDGLNGADFEEIPDQALFHSATVNVVPEPGTAALLAFGLAGLVASSRRRTR